MKAKSFNIILILLIIFSTQHKTLGQNTHHIPEDFSSIQESIDYASIGDTIIVAQGTYYENINFRGKDIYLSSEFLYDLEFSTIQNTIIDGSQPTDADTASVVLIINEESENAVLRGFTITGGAGTRIYNEDEGLYFRTGGGIVINKSSPTIINNIIRNNVSTNTTSVSGAGGGGIRAGAGQPYIANNYILSNDGRYAGGIMMAFCNGMSFVNNVVAYNHTAGDFGGGGGVYVDWQNVNITNNTIVYNNSDASGGGLCITGNTSPIKNCIIFGNTGTSFPQIRKRYSGNPVVSYCNIEAGYSQGDQILDTLPNFMDTIRFILAEESPCIDAGDPDSIYFDQTTEYGEVLLPAMGDQTNDIGAYGGSFYQLPPPEIIPEPVAVFNNTVIDYAIEIIGNKAILKTESQLKLKLSCYKLNGQLFKSLHNGILAQGQYQFELSTKKEPLIIVAESEKSKTVLKTISGIY